VVIRTYWFPGFNEASGTSTRNWCHGADHVEAWRPRVCRSYPTILPLEGMSEHASDRWLPPVEPRPEGHVTPNAVVATPPPAAPAADERPPWEEDRRGLLRRIGSAILAGLIAIVKFGKIALLFAGKLKILTTSGTMLVSVAAYSLIWGWKFAVGFVLLLLVHEMGHVIQLRREGVEASAPVFIPFLGAVVAAKSLGNDALAEARVGLAGPILGTLGAAALLPIAETTGNDFWKALAFTGFFLNLFNLLPVVPLDGGRAMAAMSPWMWWVGFFGLLVLLFFWPNPVIILLTVLAGFELYRRWQRRKDPGAKEYYKVSPRNRALVGIVYLGLIVVLVLGMDATHVARTFNDVN
jgi:Zn-dependent protease